MRRREVSSSLFILTAATFATGTVSAVDAFHRMVAHDIDRHNKPDLFIGGNNGEDDSQSNENGGGDDAGNMDAEERHQKEQDEHDAINGDVEFDFPPTSQPTEEKTLEPTQEPTPKLNPCLSVNGVIGSSETARKVTVDYAYEAETKRRATINSMPEVVTNIEALVSGMLASLVDPECSVGGGGGDGGGVGDKIVGINIDPIDQVLPIKSMDGEFSFWVVHLERYRLLLLDQRQVLVAKNVLHDALSGEKSPFLSEGSRYNSFPPHIQSLSVGNFA
mmetsp:Transcript_21792/g.64241  ORF Transcript_21792/g.64241 Transcript_21792/m.64241 type:complete len:276 (+) Transcript_21792:232-1059(+)